MSVCIGSSITASQRRDCKDESVDGSLHFYDEMFVCKSKTFSLILTGMCFVIQVCGVWGEEGRCGDGWYDHDIGGPYEDDEQYCAPSELE